MSWEQYLSIQREAIAEGEQERLAPPEACPHDGEPLVSGPGGVLFCIADGYRWPD